MRTYKATGVTLDALEVKRGAALADLIEARQADFGRGRVTLSGATADALSRFLVLEDLCAAAVGLGDEGKANAKRDGGAPSPNNSLDL